MHSPRTSFAHLKRIVPPDVTCDVPLSSQSFHVPIRKKGLAFWYCYRNAKSEVIQSFDYFLAQPQLGKLTQTPSRKLKGQASNPSHTLRQGSGRGNCLAPASSHTSTPLQAERRPGSPIARLQKGYTTLQDQPGASQPAYCGYCQAPEGIHNLARGAIALLKVWSEPIARLQKGHRGQITSRKERHQPCP